MSNIPWEAIGGAIVGLLGVGEAIRRWRRKVNRQRIAAERELQDKINREAITRSRRKGPMT